MLDQLGKTQTKIHCRGNVRIRRAPETQLALVVVPPALDFAIGHQRARVVQSSSDDRSSIT